MHSTIKNIFVASYNKNVLWNENRFVLLSQQNQFAMRMITRAFNQMKELTDYVNEHGIKKDAIVSTFGTGDGLFMLVYYGE